jgi:hypothetical protein
MAVLLAAAVMTPATAGRRESTAGGLLRHRSIAAAKALEKSGGAPDRHGRGLEHPAGAR